MKPLQVVHDVKLKICLLSDCVLTPWLPLQYECEHDATSVIVESQCTVVYSHLICLSTDISKWMCVHFIGEKSTWRWPESSHQPPGEGEDTTGTRESRWEDSAQKECRESLGGGGQSIWRETQAAGSNNKRGRLVLCWVVYWHVNEYCKLWINSGVSRGVSGVSGN